MKDWNRLAIAMTAHHIWISDREPPTVWLGVTIVGNKRLRPARRISFASLMTQAPLCQRSDGAYSKGIRGVGTELGFTGCIRKSE